MTKFLALVVEDDSDLAQLFAMALRDAGFETQVVLSGDAAMEQLGTITPDLVVLDLFLPHVSGSDILGYIRADERLAATRVIVVTASVRAAEALHTQADLVLVKPLDFIQLRGLAIRICSTETDGE